MNPNYWSNVCIVRFLGGASSTISMYGALPWVLAAVHDLEELGQRQRGWDSYGGLPLQSDARERTIQTISQLKSVDLPAPAVVLGGGGTVQLEWRRDGKELDLDLTDKNNIEYAKCDSDGNIEGGVANKNSKDELLTLAGWLLNR